MNVSHVSPFEGGFFVIFTVWGRIICIFPPFSVISLQPLTFQGEFFAFFSLSGWILCNFQPFRGNSFHFWLFKGEFFVFFTLQGWILCNFYSWGWILCNFYPSKVKSVQFLSFWDIFWVKRTKNYSCNGEFFEILVFILVIGVFLSGILRVCCFDTNHPGFFGWFVDIFYPSSVYFLQYLPFGYFLGGKWTNIFLVLINALKFWYLFKWFGLFYLEFCVGVFFFTIDPFSFIWFVDIFHPLRVNCLKLSPSWDFILVKMNKKLL